MKTLRKNAIGFTYLSILPFSIGAAFLFDGLTVAGLTIAYSAIALLSGVALQTSK